MVGFREEKAREDYSSREHLVYFIDRSYRDWWDYLFQTRKGFRHCFLAHWCGWSQRWLVINWRQSKTDFIIMYDFELQKMLTGLQHQKVTVVRFEPEPDSQNKGMLITYCSNLIARYLGLGNAVLLTPYGLYRRLLKAGGEVVYSWRDHCDEEKQAEPGTESPSRDAS